MAVTKLQKHILLAVGATTCVAIGTAIGGSLHLNWNGSGSINSVDFVTIILSSVSVLLTILTIFLAVFGFVGWSFINDRLREHSMNYFSTELKEGTPSFAMLREVVREVVYEGITTVDDEYNYQDDDHVADPTDD